MNQITLVGRLTEEPILKTKEKITKLNITIAVPRTYKNQDGIYETDFIRCVLWDNIARRTSEYCHKGDLVGVKGRLQTRIITSEDGSKKKKTEIVAEKVTFLAQSPNNNKDKSAKKASKKTSKTEK